MSHILSSISLMEKKSPKVRNSLKGLTIASKKDVIKSFINNLCEKFKQKITSYLSQEIEQQISHLEHVNQLLQTKEQYRRDAEHI